VRFINELELGLRLDSLGWKGEVIVLPGQKWGKKKRGRSVWRMSVDVRGG